MIRSIGLPTDFSPAASVAFAHALRLAVHFRCKLTILHVRDPSDSSQWGKFPHIREELQKWGMLPDGAEIADISGKLGVEVAKVDIRDGDAADGLMRFVDGHRPDLLVMATHGRVGIARWIAGSVSSDVAMETRTPALLFGPGARGFVDPDSGSLTLRSVTMPVDSSPDPRRALADVEAMLEGLDATLALVHVGEGGPSVSDASGAARQVTRLEGDVVEALVAQSQEADLMAMPTAGRHGLVDALRGSTTERVVHEAACPVLALPVSGS